MFKLETYAEVVDRALIAKRNCNRLSKANDQGRKPNQSNFLKGKFSESSFKKQGVPDSNKKTHRTCPRCGKAHTGTCYLESRACFKLARLDTSSRIVQICELNKLPIQMGANKNPSFEVEFFALTKQDDEASPSVVSSTHLVSSQLAQVLFDSSSTHSFISHGFAQRLNMVLESLNYELCVTTPSRQQMNTNKVYKFYNVLVSGRELEAYLILLDMFEFDVILGMDWLSTFHASVECFGKKVVFRIPRETKFFFKGDSVVNNLYWFQLYKQDNCLGRVVKGPLLVL